MNLVKILDFQSQVCTIEKDTGNVTGNDAKKTGRIRRIGFLRLWSFNPHSLFPYGGEVANSTG
jgi:hypothetical protein